MKELTTEDRDEEAKNKKRRAKNQSAKLKITQEPPFTLYPEWYRAGGEHVGHNVKRTKGRGQRAEV